MFQPKLVTGYAEVEMTNQRVSQGEDKQNNPAYDDTIVTTNQTTRVSS